MVASYHEFEARQPTKFQTKITRHEKVKDYTAKGFRTHMATFYGVADQSVSVRAREMEKWLQCFVLPNKQFFGELWKCDFVKFQ